MGVKEPDEPPAEVQVDVPQCPACRRKHYGLVAKRLPRRERRGASYTHAAVCPETGTPLKVRMKRQEKGGSEDDRKPWESGDGEEWKR